MKYYGIIAKCDILTKVYEFNREWPFTLYELAEYARCKAEDYAEMIERNSVLIEKDVLATHIDKSKFISDNVITLTIKCIHKNDIAIYIYVKEYEVGES